MLLPFLWNLISGAPLDGAPRTNAGWLRRGTLAVDGGAPRWWSFQARACRALVRWTTAGVVALSVWSYMLRPAQTVTTLSRAAWLTGFVTLQVAGWRSADLLLSWRQRREWLWPLHIVLAPELGFSEDLNPRRYIHLPRSFPHGSESIWITLPANFSGAVPVDDDEDDPGMLGRSSGRGQELRGARLRQLLCEKLPLDQRQFRFHLKGRDHFLEILPIPQAPRAAKVPESQALRDLLADQPETQLMIGLSALPRSGKVRPRWVEAGGVPAVVDLAAETPHLGIFAAPGAGKSVIAAALMAQVLHRGGYCVVLDRRRNSHKWAKRLPGVVYVKHVPDIHNALVALGVEANARMDALEDWDDDDGPPTITGRAGLPVPVPRFLVVVEEVNSTIKTLEDYWREHRDSGDAKMSPALRGYRDVAFMGRQPMFNLLVIGQSGDVQGMGGRDIRETLQGGKLLAKWSPQQWRMLCPEIGHMPKKSSTVGRWQLVRAGKATEIQALWFDHPDKDTESNALKEWATSGIDPNGMPVIETRPPCLIEQAIVASAGTVLRSYEDLTGLLAHAGLIDQPEQSVSLADRPALELVGTSADPEPERLSDRLVTLREAVGGVPETGIPPLIKTSITALNQARYEHKESFPDPAGKRGNAFLYRANELVHFWHNRPGYRGEEERVV